MLQTDAGHLSVLVKDKPYGLNNHRWQRSQQESMQGGLSNLHRLMAASRLEGHMPWQAHTSASQVGMVVTDSVTIGHNIPSF